MLRPRTQCSSRIIVLHQEESRDLRHGVPATVQQLETFSIVQKYLLLYLMITYGNWDFNGIVVTLLAIITSTV